LVISSGSSRREERWCISRFKWWVIVFIITLFVPHNFDKYQLCFQHEIQFRAVQFESYRWRGLAAIVSWRSERKIMRKSFSIPLKILFSTLVVITFIQTGCRNEEKMNPDGEVIAQLKKAGSDLTKPHPVEFYLYFPTQENAQKAGNELTEKQFTVVVQHAATGSDWLCLAKKATIPENSTLISLRDMLDKLAQKYGGQYDGWETAIVK
jgi:hypothetical protein